MDVQESWTTEDDASGKLSHFIAIFCFCQTCFFVKLSRNNPFVRDFDDLRLNESIKFSSSFV